MIAVSTLSNNNKQHR